MVQLNHCKNLNCEKYCITAKNSTKNKDDTPKRGLGNSYKLTSTSSGKVLSCKLCKTSTRLINNRAYTLESLRVQKEHALGGSACSNKSVKKCRGKGKPCKNFGEDIFNHPDKYIKKGINYSTVKGAEHIGSQRFECKSCSKQFNVPLDPQMGHKKYSNQPRTVFIINK